MSRCGAEGPRLADARVLPRLRSAKLRGKDVWGRDSRVAQARYWPLANARGGSAHPRCACACACACPYRGAGVPGGGARRRRRLAAAGWPAARHAHRPYARGLARPHRPLAHCAGPVPAEPAVRAARRAGIRAAPGKLGRLPTAQRCHTGPADAIGSCSRVHAGWVALPCRAQRALPSVRAQGQRPSPSAPGSGADAPDDAWRGGGHGPAHGGAPGPAPRRTGERDVGRAMPPPGAALAPGHSEGLLGSVLTGLGMSGVGSSLETEPSGHTASNSALMQLLRSARSATQQAQQPPARAQELEGTGSVQGQRMSSGPSAFASAGLAHRPSITPAFGEAAASQALAARATGGSVTARGPEDRWIALEPDASAAQVGMSRPGLHGPMEGCHTSFVGVGKVLSRRVGLAGAAPAAQQTATGRRHAGRAWAQGGVPGGGAGGAERGCGAAADPHRGGWCGRRRCIRGWRRCRGCRRRRCHGGAGVSCVGGRGRRGCGRWRSGGP
jgi:hypothetical protein